MKSKQVQGDEGDIIYKIRIKVISKCNSIFLKTISSVNVTLC